MKGNSISRVCKLNRGKAISAERNREIIRRFVQVWAPEHVNIVDELAHSEIKVKYPTIPEALVGIEAFKAYLLGFHAAFPDMTVTTGDIVAEGDKVAACWTISATHQGEMDGIPATGNPIEVSGITLYRLADSKVVEENGVGDVLGLMQQLGIIPVPEVA